MKTSTILIGKLRNNWRQRLVYVYETSDPETVETIGHPFNGGEPVRCFEPRKDWERVINLFPKEAVYD